MSKGVEQKPSKTAKGTTLVRSIANKEFNNGKFGSDELAQYFFPFFSRLKLKSGRIRTRIKQGFPPGLFEYIIARTEYFDDLFKNALNRHIPQIVLLGAGYDSRAYRFSKYNTNTKVIEIDIETTQADKLACLKRADIEIPESVEFISTDFNKERLEDVLAGTGFDIREQALFLCEGVMFYLEPESVDKTLQSIKNISRKESRIAFDYLVRIPRERSDKLYGVKNARDFMKKNNPHEINKFLIEEGKAESFLKQRGFEIAEHLNNTEIEERFLTDKRQTLIGHIIASFRFVLAKTVS